MNLGWFGTLKWGGGSLNATGLATLPVCAVAGLLIAMLLVIGVLTWPFEKAGWWACRFVKRWCAVARGGR